MIVAKKQGNKEPYKLDQERLRGDTEEYLDSYSRERVERLEMSASNIRYTKKRLGVSYKKNTKSPESGFAHDMPRTYGYSLKGEHCYDKHE